MNMKMICAYFILAALILITFQTASAEDSIPNAENSTKIKDKHVSQISESDLEKYKLINAKGKKQAEFILKFTKAKELQIKFDQVEYSFRTLVSKLEEETKISMFIETQAFEELGIDINDTLDCELQGKTWTFEQLIDILENQHEITFMIRNGYIRVTSTECMDKVQFNKLFDITSLDLVRYKSFVTKEKAQVAVYGQPKVGCSYVGELEYEFESKTPPGNITTSPQNNTDKPEYVEVESVDYSSLIIAIQNLGGEWIELDGEGGLMQILETQNGVYLLISQNQKTMDGIEEFLLQLKNMEDQKKQKNP